jgi:UDPglucose--hexose-1-phosphate uridylyltransferase
MTDQHPHRRFNPLRNDWVLVSPQRTARPWQGQVESREPEVVPAYDPACYLCPGNSRAHGATNPAYPSTFVFDNDFPALTPENSQLSTLNSESDRSLIPNPQSLIHGQSPTPTPQSLLLAQPERGICRVICFSPRHDLTLARMEPRDVRRVVDVWAEECAAAAAHPWVRYALVFENRGAMIGASNPHPHGQLWATENVPNEPAREGESFARYRAEHGSCLLCDYTGREERLVERVVCDNDAFMAIVPFWATWPFETLVLSRRHVGSIEALDAAERDALADMFKRLTARYDNLFEAPFPYSMGFHQEPTNGAAEGWHLHAHFYPPLLRSATIRKFMIGFELLGSPQRDVTPEAAAARLRALSDVHYRVRAGAGASR